VNIWRSYRQEVTNRPLIICKSILHMTSFSSASQQMRTVILSEF